MERSSLTLVASRGNLVPALMVRVTLTVNQRNFDNFMRLNFEVRVIRSYVDKYSTTVSPILQEN